MADDDQSTNNEQAAALAEMLAPLVAQVVQEKVEEQIQGVVRKNDELLNKLAAAKTENAERFDKLEKQTATPEVPQEIVISRDDARSVQAYRAAKKRADELGVPLRIDRDLRTDDTHDPDAVVAISKAQALNPRVYGEAKQRAQDEGKRLVITAGE